MKRKMVCLAVVCTLVLTSCGTNENPVSGDFTQESVTTLNQDTTDSISNVGETPDNFYAAATGLPASQVEEYASVIKKMVLEEEWAALAGEVSYPVTMDGLIVEEAKGFTELITDNQVREEFVAAIEAETCQKMFCSWQGISLGEQGQIWMAAVQDEQGEFELKITGINGMLVQ